VDQFRDRYGKRPSIDTERPDIRLHLILKGEVAAVCIDLSGDSLHMRGYRGSGGEAPLKESLAAAILSLSGWNREIPSEYILLDPMCGSGTLLIEAALIYGDIAPGLGRGYYGFKGWKGHDQALWENLLEEASERKKKGMSAEWPRIVGYDADRIAVNAAMDNIRQGGLTGIIHVEKRDLANLFNPLKKKKEGDESAGLIVTNPPYGERLGSHEWVRYMYRFLGRRMREDFNGWQAGVFTAEGGLFTETGIRALKKYNLYNGPIACQLNIVKVPDLYEERKSSDWRLNAEPSEGGAEDFGNRLKKNFRQLNKWARRESVSCYRIYDGDIPEYNVAVDLYEKWVHVQEYAPPKTVDPDKAGIRIKQVIKTIQDLLGVSQDMIFIKERRKQKGKLQYQKMNTSGKLYEVREANCRFLVNFTDYLDTGLFLDHRITRNLIQEKAQGKRFLNLFGYTGTATVHAAMGGAKSTMTVDLSHVYLDWTRCNLSLNGFGETNHKQKCGDCMEWLEKTNDQFDLIFVDPPTFSNSKRLNKVFDVQKDHAELIKAAARRLEHDGLILFSTNFRRFKMDQGALAEFHLEDITQSTIPKDFERNHRIHQCWLIRRNK
jgi:23S rRNA (guanine2445-N2)-methyltransferase / 23S rRNA (guanine2069-N7)-methyltransferase